MRHPSDKPRVALCIPSGDTWKSLTGFHVMSLGAYSAPHVTLMPINVRTQDTAESRNQMTAAALDEDADYLLWIDADMIMPPDALLRLLKRDVDVVGADYRRRAPPFPRIGKPIDASAPDRGMVEVSMLGLGLMLIRADVLKKMMRPWFLRMWVLEHAAPDNPSGFSTEDGYFCGYARHLGYTVWADLDLSQDVGHIAEQLIPWDMDGGAKTEGVGCLKTSA
jgi:hypothetical protein